MYGLPPDRKQYILQQHKDFRSTSSSKTSVLKGSKVGHAPQPSYSATYGPSSGATHPPLTPQLTGGLMKRFSIVGWRSASPTPTTTSGDVKRLSADIIPSEGSPRKAQMDKAADNTTSLQPQSTGGLWSSWWTTSGGDKDVTAGDKVPAKNTSRSASWYVNGIRAGSVSDPKFVKHLISMRVHLSTAALVWIEEFLVEEKGMDALGTVLANLVGKGGKKRALVDIEATVLLEVIKCMRVLLNTEVIPFNNRRALTLTSFSSPDSARCSLLRR